MSLAGKTPGALVVAGAGWRRVISALFAADEPADDKNAGGLLFASLDSALDDEYALC